MLPTKLNHLQFNIKPTQLSLNCPVGIFKCSAQWRVKGLYIRFQSVITPRLTMMGRTAQYIASKLNLYTTVDDPVLISVSVSLIYTHNNTLDSLLTWSLAPQLLLNFAGIFRPSVFPKNPVPAQPEISPARFTACNCYRDYGIFQAGGVDIDFMIKVFPNLTKSYNWCV